jgi:hypothetical protein
MHRRGGVATQAAPSRVDTAVWGATETLLLAVSRTRTATRGDGTDAVRATPSCTAAFAPPVSASRTALLEWECLPGAAHAHLLTQLRSPVLEHSVRASTHALLDALVAPVRESTEVKQHRTPGPYDTGPLRWTSTVEAVVSRPSKGWLNPYPQGTPLAKLCEAKRVRRERDKSRRVAVQDAVDAALTGVLAVANGAARGARWSDMQAALEKGATRDAEHRARSDAHGARLDALRSSLRVSLKTYGAEAARLLR